MKFRAIRDKILVQVEEQNNVTQAGLILVSNSCQDYSIGTVVSVGSGRIDKNTGQLIPFTIKEGDRVFVSRGAGTTISDKTEFKNYIIIKEEDIFGII